VLVPPLEVPASQRWRSVPKIEEQPAPETRQRPLLFATRPAVSAPDRIAPHHTEEAGLKLLAPFPRRRSHLSEFCSLLRRSGHGLSASECAPAKDRRSYRRAPICAPALPCELGPGGRFLQDPAPQLTG